MSKTTYKYFLPDHGQDADDTYEFESYLEAEGTFDKECLATLAADDYHSNHDGWEASWPLVITLLTADGAVLGSFDVDREAVPEFYARLKKSG